MAVTDIIQQRQLADTTLATDGGCLTGYAEHDENQPRGRQPPPSE